MKTSMRLTAMCATVLASTAAMSVARAADVERTPRLVVLLIVDQMRGDYIDRFDAQWTQGLHRLVTQGAWFRQAQYPYADTFTCPGHASVSTGSIPAVHGIILNEWWDRESQSQVTCTQDRSVSTISYGKAIAAGPGDSTARLRVPTLADEMRAQLHPASRVVAFSLKARSAVTLAGRRADAIAWFDDSGTWVTSTAFSSGPVPAVADFVRRHPVEADFGKTWERLLPKTAYQFEDPGIGVTSAKGMTVGFPHVVKGTGSAPDRSFYDQWETSPYSDAYLAQMALDVAGKMRLGQSAGTDLLAVSFSSLDKVGHEFGPNSHEVQDVLVRLDRLLGDLFAGLDRLVGPDRYTVALTGDHGVAPIPERSRGEALDAGRVDKARILHVVEGALSAALGAGSYVAHLVQTSIYLGPGVFERLRDQPGGFRHLREALEAVPGVARVYTRDDLTAAGVHDDPIAQRLVLSYEASRSADVVFVLKPYWTLRPTGAEHGTVYRYDSHVPILLMGKGIVPGEYLADVSPLDVAPTLAFLAGVTLPRPQGRVLTEALAPGRRSVSSRPSSDR